MIAFCCMCDMDIYDGLLCGYVNQLLDQQGEFYVDSQDSPWQPQPEHTDVFYGIATNPNFYNRIYLDPKIDVLYWSDTNEITPEDDEWPDSIKEDIFSS